MRYIFRGNAAAGIFDLDLGDIAVSGQADIDISLHGVFDGVIDDVLENFPDAVGVDIGVIQRPDSFAGGRRVGADAVA
jgi:hypothetical protein